MKVKVWFIVSYSKQIRSNVNNSSQFLNAIQQQVSLLYRFLILCVFRVWSVGFNHHSNFINYCMNSSCCNESWQIPINFIVLENKGDKNVKEGTSRWNLHSHQTIWPLIPLLKNDKIQVSDCRLQFESREHSTLCVFARMDHTWCVVRSSLN